MKLDADIILPNNYILEVSKRMNSNLQIGLCGGICLTKGLEEKNYQFRSCKRSD